MIYAWSFPTTVTRARFLILGPPFFSTDVPSWLKSLRLHKYAALFSQMSYEEMMTLTEQHLESQVKPRGPSGRGWGQYHFDITLAARASSVSLGLVGAP